jgi:hypothetical protein
MEWDAGFGAPPHSQICKPCAIAIGNGDRIKTVTVDSAVNDFRYGAIHLAESCALSSLSDHAVMESLDEGSSLNTLQALKLQPPVSLVSRKNVRQCRHPMTKQSNEAAWENDRI